jgi:cold shock CspA family protein
MAKSQESFNKKDKEAKRLKKRKEKQQKQQMRKATPKASGLENMLAYVDEYGQITDTPPDPSKKLKVDAASIELGVPKREKDVMPAVRMGKIEFFNEQKGYGFIKENETQEKYFVHVNGLTESVKENDKISFELELGMKGINAVKVKRV